MPKRSDVVVCSPPRADGRLSVMQVSERECVLSTGECLFIRYEKLRALAEAICQEQAAIQMPRIWWTADAGNELIELTRVKAGEPSTNGSTATPSGDCDDHAF